MAKDVQTHLFPHTGFDELEQSKIEEMSYEHYHLHAPAEESELPLKWHEACPCMGKRIVTCHLVASSDTELKFIFSGQTWAFRDALDEFGVKGRLGRSVFILFARPILIVCECLPVSRTR